MAQYKQIKLSLILVSSTFSTLAYSAGFSIMEQSVTGLGRAFSGSAAVADDASTLFFNPAGLSYLSHSEFTTGLHFIVPKSDFNDDGSATAVAVGGAPLTGGDSDGGANAFVPNLYYAHRINDKVVAGIGITAPFGLVTEYSDNWKGRYHAIKSDLKTVNFNPSVAFQSTEKLSVGFGLNLQYIEVELSQAVDFGSVCAGTALAGLCGVPQGFDGKATLTADDWSWGYNLGMIYQVTDMTRLALAYRSKISHHLKGKGVFSLPDNANIQTVASLGGFANGHIDSKVTLPETLSFALHHQVNDRWALMADATWTRWNRFQQLLINSTDSVRLNSSKDEKWHNSMRYGIGFDYKHSDKWTFRGGVAYDETPVSNEYRTARIPDNDRTWLAMGVSYAYSDTIMLDAGYTHIFLSDPKINESLDAPLNHTLSGDYKASVDILSAQMRWIFL